MKKILFIFCMTLYLLPITSVDAMNGNVSTSAASTCSSTTEGTITYDSTNKLFKFCNGSGWISVSSATITSLSSLSSVHTNGAACGSTDKIGLDSSGSLLVCRNSVWTAP
jgi:hypothetical protein